MSADLTEDAPLLAAWLRHAASAVTAFTIPGHKGRAAELWAPLGAVLAGDVPLYGGLDAVKLTGGVLAEAERRAAAFWGGDWCRFSTGGSTHTNQVAALAVAAPGDTVLVARSAHRSTLLGLVMAGLRPVWLPTTVDERTDVPLGVEPSTLEAALREHPQARAVFLVEPSYLGGLSDRVALIELAHAAGLPVIADQAWGAHFGLHPALPPHALAVGADVMVLSAHKTLPAYSQASVIVARTAGPGRLEPARLERAFEAANTTSPAGSILASIDGARALLAHEGPALAVSLLGIVARARERLRAVDGLLVPGPEDFPPGRFDAAKLVVGVAGTGASGVAVEDELIAAGLPVEMADHDTVVPIVTVADTEETVGRLVEALIAAVEAHRGEPRALAPAVHWTTPPPAAALDPRAAFFAPAEPVPADEAVGRICAEVVAPYPPGVPVLVPGEVVTAEILAALRSVRDRGTRIAYAADPTLTTLQVLSPSASPPLSPRS